MNYIALEITEEMISRTVTAS